uniref:Nidogen 2 n=1 Tax=Equus asinus asinus TaxID=83772 RepID=A0A8C4PL60_EQUAS
ISTQDFPRETQYVDDGFPTDFPAIAPFLADVDTSQGRGRVLFREDTSPEVLALAARYVRTGFPRAAHFAPTHAFLATWAQVGAYEEPSAAPAGHGRNTFQAVLASDESDTYALFLYPAGGLQFFGTRPKESYNVQLELPARVGFCRGEATGLKGEAPYFSLTSTEQSVKNLYQHSNLGVPGVWAFHIGSTSPLDNVRPAAAGGGLSAAQTPAPPGQPFSHVAALEGDDAEDDLDYYDGNEEETRSPCVYCDLAAVWCRRVPGGGSHDAGPPRPLTQLFLFPVFTYNAAGKETCEQNHGRCSRHAFCTDYATGFCCHCQSRFYGNGQQCLPEGAPHRVNGKVSGHLRVGPTPVHFTDVDLHAYIVSNDGRAYMAISHIPQPAAHALLPLTPIGGLFGWLFALEKPGWTNGFSLTGAAFTHDMEVTFHPGGERLLVTQTAEGLDPENYLSIRTHIRGQAPSIPANLTVHVAPYKELYHYADSAVTSASSRDYALAAGAVNQTRSYRVLQNITFQACRHAPRPRAAPAVQQLSVDRVFAWYAEDEGVLRFAMTSLIGPAGGSPTPVNPCYDGSHACAMTARCRPGAGVDYSCECAPGYQGDGRSCADVNECATGFHRCGPNAMCVNLPGSYRCECRPGYEFADDGHTCRVVAPPPSPCEDGSHSCAPGQARCIPRGGGAFSCACLPGYSGDGHQCSDVDECSQDPCHPAASCHNTPGSFSCRCRPGYHGDGLRCPTPRPRTVCERWRETLLELYGGAPGDDQYVPQCDEWGHFTPLQCHGRSDFCWCVDRDGREVPGTRSQPGTTPACVPTVAPPTVQPTPRPDVTPPPVGTYLLYAQGQQIGHLPLNGTRLQKDAARTLLSLHGSIVVGIDYDCQERMVYWTDVAGRTISRASLEPGAEPETIISSGLMSPEGLAIDHVRRTMYWTDSGLDKIERARLDGSERKALFHTDLVNPRAIAVDPIRGNLYWTDWNREAPKIETSSLEGENRRILVNKDIGLPNGLTFDAFSKLLCWADAGTKRLECTLPDGAGRRVIQSSLNYPFSLVSYAGHFYHTDWRRDGVISVDRDSGQFTDEYLPEQRSHLYGITAVHPYCPAGRPHTQAAAPCQPAEGSVHCQTTSRPNPGRGPTHHSDSH